jgi:hypothetical protein
MQTRRQSMFEAIINILVGFSINMVLNCSVFPLFGWHISLSQNLALGAIYTVVSIIRSYCLRRFFNKAHAPKHTADDVHLGVGV